MSRGHSACDLHSTHYLAFPLHFSFEISNWDQVSLTVKSGTFVITVHPTLP